jgi:hypothetical protein
MDSFGVSKQDRIALIEARLDMARKSLYNLALEKHFTLATEDAQATERIDKQSIKIQKVIALGEKVLAETKAEKG